jgi:hypothetical protein
LISGALSEADQAFAWVAVGRDDETDAGFGTDLEDHFHPGVLVLSSSKERIRSADGVPVSFAAGRRSIVIENPGMLRLV